MRKFIPRKIAPLLISSLALLLIFGFDSPSHFYPEMLHTIAEKHVRYLGPCSEEQFRDTCQGAESGCVHVRGVDGSVRYECWHFNPTIYGVIPNGSVFYGCDFPDYSPSVIEHYNVSKSLNGGSFTQIQSDVPTNEWNSDALVDTFVTGAYDSLKYKFEFYDEFGQLLGDVTWVDISD